jgi:hypothetical protein
VAGHEREEMLWQAGKRVLFLEARGGSVWIKQSVAYMA